MAVDFLRDFGPSAEEKDAERARKQTQFEHMIPWSDSKGLPDLERKVTRLHQGLKQTGWPPGAKPVGTQRRGSKGRLSFTASGQASFASGNQSPGNNIRLASLAPTPTSMSLSNSAPNLGAQSPTQMQGR